MLDWLAPYCADNGTNWPWKMTNNTGEGTSGELPRCRIIYSWAALLFPSRHGTYSSIATAASGAEASYFAPFMRSSADVTRLFFFKSDDRLGDYCAHFGANATATSAGWCYADDRTGVAHCEGCCAGAADCGACTGGKRTAVYPCRNACPELGGAGCAVHSGGVDCSACCCGTAASANCNASCGLFKRQGSNCVPGCLATGGAFVCTANDSCTVCAACCNGTQAASECEACARERCLTAASMDALSPEGSHT